MNISSNDEGELKHMFCCGTELHPIPKGLKYFDAFDESITYCLVPKECKNNCAYWSLTPLDANIFVQMTSNKFVKAEPEDWKKISDSRKAMNYFCAPKRLEQEVSTVIRKQLGEVSFCDDVHHSFAKYIGLDESILPFLIQGEACIAGGSVAAAMCRDTKFPDSSDIDLFVFNSNEVLAKRIVEHIRGTGRVPCATTTHGVSSLIGIYGQRKIQVILRKERSEIDLLKDFDMTYLQACISMSKKDMKFKVRGFYLAKIAWDDRVCRSYWMDIPENRLQKSMLKGWTCTSVQGTTCKITKEKRSKLMNSVVVLNRDLPKHIQDQVLIDNGLTPFQQDHKYIAMNTMCNEPMGPYSNQEVIGDEVNIDLFFSSINFTVGPSVRLSSMVYLDTGFLIRIPECKSSYAVNGKMKKARVVNDADFDPIRNIMSGIAKMSSEEWKVLEQYPNEIALRVNDKTEACVAGVLSNSAPENPSSEFTGQAYLSHMYQSEYGCVIVFQLKTMFFK